MAHFQVQGGSGRLFRDSALAVFMLVVLGASIGILTGVAAVEVLSLLGLHVDGDVGTVLHQAFLG